MMRLKPVTSGVKTTNAVAIFCSSGEEGGDGRETARVVSRQRAERGRRGEGGGRSAQRAPTNRVVAVLHRVLPRVARHRALLQCTLRCARCDECRPCKHDVLEQSI